METVREYKALKEENTRRKRLVADLFLDNQALMELAAGKGEARSANGRWLDISNGPRR